MFNPKPEFTIRADPVINIEDILAMIDKIKKAHPNAVIRVEVEM